MIDVHIKHYLMIMLDAILLSVVWLESVDLVLKTMSLLLGIAIGVYTIVKIREDLGLTRIQRKIKEEELRKIKNR
jgi:hypothetical protein